MKFTIVQVSALWYWGVRHIRQPCQQPGLANRVIGATADGLTIQRSGFVQAYVYPAIPAIPSCILWSFQQVAMEDYPFIDDLY
jgi:hypothetical protein